MQIVRKLAMVFVLALMAFNVQAMPTDKPLTKKVVMNAVQASMDLRSKYNKGYERNPTGEVRDEMNQILAKSGFNSLTQYHSVVGRILNAYLVHKKQTPLANKSIKDEDIAKNDSLTDEQKQSLLAARKVMAEVEQDQKTRAKQDMPAVLAHLDAVQKAFDQPLRKSKGGGHGHHGHHGHH